MRGRPQFHLLSAWAGVLQQQEDAIGEQHPASLVQLQRSAVALWMACAGAALVTRDSSVMSSYSRWLTASSCAAAVQEDASRT